MCIKKLGRERNYKNLETCYNNPLLKEGKDPKDVKSYRHVAQQIYSEKYSKKL